MITRYGNTKDRYWSGCLEQSIKLQGLDMLGQRWLNAGRGKDDTIFAKVAGRVKFEDHGAKGRVISIQPLE